MGCLGGLLLLPLFCAIVLVKWFVGVLVAKKGGLWRLIGVLVSLAIGGVCIQVGYWFGIEGFTEWQGLAYRQVTYPVLGWIDMIGGGLIALIGTVASFVVKNSSS